MSFTPIIYTYGGGQGLNSLFQSMSILFDFTKHTEIQWMGRIAGLLGVIWISMSGFASRGKDGSPGAIDWTWFLRFAMIWIVLIVPRTQVEIQDRITKATYSVSGVPWSLSIFGWFTSSFGDWLTSMYENVLGGGMNTATSYSGNGVAFGSSYYNSLPKIARFDGVSSTKAVFPFIQECLVPAAGPINSRWSGVTKEALLTTPSYRALVQGLSTNFLQNRYVNVDGVSVTCLTLRDQVLAQWDANSLLLMSQMGMSESKIENLDQAYILQATTQQSNSLRQAMMMNAIQDAVAAGAVQWGDAAMADSMYQAQAQYQQVTAWRQGSQLASVSLVWMHIVGESMVYALFPLLIFLMLLPMGFTVIMVYLRILFWLQTWPILYAVLNWIIAIYATSQSQQLAMQYGGFTMSDFYKIGDMNDGVVAAAGYLSTMVPILSWMLLNQAGAFISSVAGSISGSVSNTAESAGKQEALGSMDVNRVTVSQRTVSSNTHMGESRTTVHGVSGEVSTIGNGNNSVTTTKSGALDNKMTTSVDYNKVATNQVSNQIQALSNESGTQSEQWNQIRSSAHNASLANQGGNSKSSGDGGKAAANLSKYEELAGNLAASGRWMNTAELGLKILGSGASSQVQYGVEGKMSSAAGAKYAYDLQAFKDFTNQHKSSLEASLGDTFQNSQGLADSSSKTTQAALNLIDTNNNLQSTGSTLKTNGDFAFNQHLQRDLGMSGKEINDMQMNEPTKFNQLAETYAKDVFVPKVIGDSHDYSVKNVDVAGTRAKITKLSQKYSNNGAVDKVGANAQGVINTEQATVTGGGLEVGGAYNSSKSKWDTNKSEVAGAVLAKTVSNAGSAVFDAATIPIGKEIKKSGEKQRTKIVNGTTGTSKAGGVTWGAPKK